MGYALPSPLLASGDALNDLQRKTISWAINTILRVTPATSVYVVRNFNEVVGRGGVVGLEDDRSPSFMLGGQTEAELEAKMGIFYKSVSSGEEVYLPDFSNFAWEGGVPLFTSQCTVPSDSSFEA